MLDLDKGVEFKVKFEGKEISLREPTAKEVKDLADSQSKDGEVDFEKMFGFLEMIGMPEGSCERLGINQLNSLVDGVTGALKKK